ncbi:hypothetical protein WOB98_08950 [Vibrio parahaemolyticus]|uniref:hypothetical protein n=1 Tax=Vibrio parahaemolyticus TaxID=670 RepID=UPI000412DB24|nr:hypothetical protein [Vibrio parahaemolyticus]EGR3219649.1 hypothetical protein [Vibrio parahaemolyticus]EJC6919563.1 hypothetical protein [Vibrio parahaemolyticus]MCC3845791.1 hypothetical protein [Vibrio parahaemolyticus]
MSFSKREWLFSILIISLVQAFVWYAAFVNAGNGSALNFISFAGTLISIILAVLAIGYTYGESLSQKNQSDTVVNQIATLNQAIGNIKDQTEELNQIHEISESLTAFGKQVENRFDATHKEVESISCAMQELTSFRDKHYAQSIPVHLESKDRQLLSHALCETRQPISEIGIMATLLIDGRNREALLRDGIGKYLDLADDRFENEDHEQSKSVLGGSAFACFCLLEAVGLVTYNDSLLKVDEYFKREFIKIVKEQPMDSGKFYHAVREEMLKELC